MAFDAPKRYAREKARRAAANEPPLNANKHRNFPGAPSKSSSAHPGTFIHKLGCKCSACKSRNWTAEAVIRTTGTGEDTPEGVAPGDVIHADLPQIVAGAPIGSRQRNVRDTIGEWAVHRFQDPTLNTTQIAEKMGIGARYLSSLIAKAGREGWLRFDNPLDRIENEIIPKTLDNLSEFLDKKDRTVTIETAKGTLFKQFQEAKGISDNKPMVLALKIETAAPMEQAVVIQGNIVGKAKQITVESEG